MTVIKLPTQLRDVAGGAAEVTVEGDTVKAALESLFAQHEELRSRITEDGELRRFVNVYLAGEDIRYLDGIDTPVRWVHDGRLGEDGLQALDARAARRRRGWLHERAIVDALGRGKPAHLGAAHPVPVPRR
jgi:molybdopterin synthase sulfur carrier subunit